MPRPQVNIDRVFHALGDPTRRAILEKLSEGPLSVSRLATPLDITLTAVVQHLRVLNSLARCWGAPIHEGLANFLIREPRGRNHEPGLLLT
jgi:hypothetical protein